MGETFDVVPKVKTRGVRRRDGIWDLYITCPFCGVEHHHGGGNRDRPKDTAYPTAVLMLLTTRVCWSTNWYEHNCGRIFEIEEDLRAKTQLEPSGTAYGGDY